MKKIIVIILLIIIIPIIIFINFNKEKNKEIIPQVSIESNKTDNISNTNNSIYNVCEGCHLSGKSSIPQALNVRPHLEGGNYCLICHKFSHDKHPMKNKNVTCENCHGYKNETIPVSGPNIVCINCHDYPDPLKPSNGNLIRIHRLRDVSCINCHADNCTKCHANIGTNERWEKRLVHFRTILGLLR